MIFDQKTYKLSLRSLVLDQDLDLDRIRIQQQPRNWIRIQRIRIRNIEFLYRFVILEKVMNTKVSFPWITYDDHTFLLFIRPQELYLP
jgi:hypothetical protein